MEAILDEAPDIDILFAHNDDMALGAICYLREDGIFTPKPDVRNQPLVIVGVDGTEVGKKQIEKRFQYGTVLNDSEKQADAIVTLIDYLLNGRDLSGFPYNIERDRYIYIDGDIITADNVKEFSNNGSNNKVIETPSNRGAAGPIMEKAKAAGIPIVFFRHQPFEDIANAAAKGIPVNSDTIGYEVTNGKYVWIPYVKITADNYGDFIEVAE